MSELETSSPLKLNVDLLERIAHVIVRQSSEFDMAAWHDGGTCNTTHCIGGWAQKLSGLPETDDAKEMARLLGLEYVPNPMIPTIPDTDCQAGRLFYSEEWPSEFYERYEEATDSDSREMAEVTADYIRYFIRTEQEGQNEPS